MTSFHSFVVNITGSNFYINLSFPFFTLQAQELCKPAEFAALLQNKQANIVNNRLSGHILNRFFFFITMEIFQ